MVDTVADSNLSWSLCSYRRGEGEGGVNIHSISLETTELGNDVFFCYCALIKVIKTSLPSSLRGLYIHPHQNNMSVEHISLREFSKTERNVIEQQLESICARATDRRRTSICKKNPERGEGKHIWKPTVQKNINMEFKKKGLVQDVIMRSDSVWILKNTQLGLEGVASASHHKRRITRHGGSIDAKGVLFIDCIFVVREGEDTAVFEHLLNTVHTFAATSGFTHTATLAISRPFLYTSSDRGNMERDSNSQWVDRFSDLWSMWHDMGYAVDEQALHQLEQKDEHGLFLHHGLVMDDMLHATVPKREARIRLLGMPISKLTKTTLETLMADAVIPKQPKPPQKRKTMVDEGPAPQLRGHGGSSADISRTKSDNDAKGGSVDSDSENGGDGSNIDGTSKNSDESGPIHSSDNRSKNRDDDSSSTMVSDDSDGSTNSRSTTSMVINW